MTREQKACVMSLLSWRNELVVRLCRKDENTLRCGGCPELVGYEWPRSWVRNRAAETEMSHRYYKLQA